MNNVFRVFCWNDSLKFWNGTDEKNYSEINAIIEARERKILYPLNRYGYGNIAPNGEPYNVCEI